MTNSPGGDEGEGTFAQQMGFAGAAAPANQSGSEAGAEGGVDGAHQVRFFERFGQEVDRAGLDRAYRSGNIAVSRDEHDVWVRPLAVLA